MHVSLFRLASAADGVTTARTEEAQGPSSAVDEVVPLSSRIFDVPHHPTLLHMLVVAHLASLRRAMGVNKDRGQVIGSGRKLHRQKGTGRARVKDAQSPIRRGGGRAFAKTTARNWRIELPRRAWVSGMRVALSLRWRDGGLGVVDGIPQLVGQGVQSIHNGVTGTFGRGPVRELERLLHHVGLLGERGTLFLLSDAAMAIDAPSHIVPFIRAARKLRRVEVKRAIDVNVVDLLKYSRIMFDLTGLGELVAKLESDRGLLGHSSRPLVPDSMIFQQLPPVASGMACADVDHGTMIDVEGVDKGEIDDDWVGDGATVHEQADQLLQEAEQRLSQR